MAPTIFLTEKNINDNTRDYLWPLIPKNSLVITAFIFPNIDRISDLKLHLSNSNSSTVYLDLSHNPEIINAQYATNVFDQLREITPLKIIVNEYAQFYKPKKDFIYYPIFFYALSHGDLVSIGDSCKFPGFSKKTKSFMSLNKRATWNRIWLFTELASNNLLDKLEYSFLWNPKLNHYNEPEKLSEYKRVQAKSFFDLLPIGLSTEGAGINNYINIYKSFDIDCQNSCAVNIVTESCSNLGFLTEKICKPLACYQIPILLSHVGATQFCVDAGFDMFEDIIPWKTWDSIEDEKQRCDVACKFIVDYIKNGDALADWHRCQHRVIANRERLTSDDFKKFCIAQFIL